MPKFNCSYAYDVSCYYNLTIEAADEREVQAKLEEALKAEKFGDCCGKPDWGSAPQNERVFVSGLADNQDAPADDLDNLK